VTIQANDVIVLSATRNTLTEVINDHPNDFSDDMTGAVNDQHAGNQVLAEVVIAPASRIIGRNLRQIAFHHRTNCVVMGIQRRSHMIRAQMTDIRLEAGDVLLLLGHRNDILALRNNPDVLLMEWSARELPARRYAKRATAIFLAVVLAAATDLVPIVVAAVAGATAMIMSGCLNVHQASRAVDRRVLLLVWTALALAAALQATGGAATLAHGLVGLLTGAPVAVILSAFFLLVAVLTNVLSNNATAVLFTPIAINVARELQIDPSVFIFATIFAANCSFATPMGYQTNLLVMGPGHYRFSDFVRAGTPLIILIWLSYSLFAVWYYQLW
jgi:di/tricarboxylate transporter